MKIRKIFNLKKIFIILMQKNIIPIEDKKLLNILYKERFQKNINWENPKTFNEKIQWLKIYDRKDIYSTMVDKYEAKKYVADIIGEKYIIPTYGVFNNYEEIDFDNLPNQFVIKPTHTSGDIFICKDKNKIDYEKLKKQVNNWLKKRYYFSGREWPYKNVKPRIIIEEYKVDDNNDELMDYKIMCFNSKVRCSFVCSNRRKELNVDFYDYTWKKMPCERHYKNSKNDIAKPINYDKMIQFSELLSKDIAFLRVDWYEISGRLYFGELTFFPGSGFEKFSPEKWDTILGDMIVLPIDEKMEVK